MVIKFSTVDNLKAKEVFNHESTKQLAEFVLAHGTMDRATCWTIARHYVDAIAKLVEVEERCSMACENPCGGCAGCDTAHALLETTEPEASE